MTFAEAPTTWENVDNGSTVEHLLFLLGVPALVFLVVWVLVYLPSMMNRQSAEPAVASQDKSEWFGGPRKGVGAAPDTAPEDSADKGGASARW
jgi:hypothetical protein